MDLSDSDLPVSDAGNDSFEGIQMSRHRPNVFLPRAYSPEEILIDFASSSDEDDLFADPALLGRGTGRHGNADGDDDSSFGDIYPYAWALDGRRIGENMPLARPASPSSSFMVSTQHCIIQVPWLCQRPCEAARHCLVHKCPGSALWGS